MCLASARIASQSLSGSASIPVSQSLKDDEDPGIVQAVFIRSAGHEPEHPLLPVPKGTLSEIRAEGKTVVFVTVPIFPILASLLRK